VPRRLLLAISVYAGLALLVVGWGWLLTRPLESTVDPADDDISRWIAGERSSWLDPVAGAGTLLADTAVGLAVGAAVAVVAGLAMRSFLPAVLLVLADFGNAGIYWVAAQANPRDRPPVRILDPGLVPTHSFPSGHVGTAIAVYGGAAVLLAVWLRRRGRSGGPAGAVVVLLAAVPLLVAASRLYEGAHHLTDVVTSLVFGTVWLVAVSRLVRPWPDEAPVPRSSRGLEHAPVPHG
jgi:membrane-associated phospholipid phosphatase